MIVSGIYPQCYAQNMKLVKQLGCMLPQHFSWFSSRVLFAYRDYTDIWRKSCYACSMGLGKGWDIVATAFINLHFKRAGGRDHFLTILTSFKRRASNKDIQDNIQIIKQKYWDCFSPINSLWLEIKVDLLGNLLITQSPSKGHLV